MTDGRGRGDAGGVGQETGAGVVVGDEGDVRDAQILSVTLVVTEEEKLVLLERATERAAVVVALEVGDAGLVEVVAGVEEGVAEELVGGAVDLVCAGGGYD